MTNEKQITYNHNLNMLEEIMEKRSADVNWMKGLSKQHPAHDFSKAISNLVEAFDEAFYAYENFQITGVLK